MSNSWDIPDFPIKGDATEDVTFASVGRALSRWEEFETRLASLFGVFMGTLIDTHETNARAAIRAYGSVASFRGKAEMLEQAAELWFDEHPSEELEKKLRDLLRLASRYAARRNDIAHGIVHPLWNPGNRSKTLATACSRLPTIQEERLCRGLENRAFSPGISIRQPN
jgi:hypothetical protein